MRARALVAVLTILLSAAAVAADDLPGAEPGVRFRFALGARPADDPERLVSLDEGGELASGSQLKLLVLAEGPCAVYVFHEAPDGAITPLLILSPESGSDLHYYPEDDRWMTLDDEAGLESFHLLASATRLQELQQLLERRLAAEGDRARALDRAILEEVRRLRSQHKQSLVTQAVRPIPVGGGVRSAGGVSRSWLDRLGKLAVEVRAEEFFARAISIEHH